MKRYGKCPICKRWIRVTNLDRLFKHGSANRRVWPPQNCGGWAKEPTEFKEVA